MRLNEPLGGIVLVSGDLIFHVALIMASTIVIQFPKYDDRNKNFMFFINMNRAAHMVCIIYRLIEWRIQKAGEYFHQFMFTQKLFETISMFFYFGVSVYTLWGISHYDVSDELLKEDIVLQKERTWLFIEISSFIL